MQWRSQNFGNGGAQSMLQVTRTKRVRNFGPTHFRVAPPIISGHAYGFVGDAHYCT